MRAPHSTLLVVCLFVVLAGCGGPTGTTTENPTSTAPTETLITNTASSTTQTTQTPQPTPTADRSETTVGSRQAWTVTVTDVVDGDTMDVRFANGTAETVRLLGVDTPEVYVENDPAEFEGIPETDAGEAWLHGWGENASAFARSELAGETVTIALDPAADRRGSYGRLLVYIETDDGLFNRRLLARGYARYYDAPLTRAGEFQRIELRARNGTRGLWAYPRERAPARLDGPYSHAA
jgi:micrococcal nuclease